MPTLSMFPLAVGWQAELEEVLEVLDVLETLDVVEWLEECDVVEVPVEVAVEVGSIVVAVAPISRSVYNMSKY